MEMMRKVLEYRQSPIYRVERARQRGRSNDRGGLSEGKRRGSTREWSPTRERAGIGFVFMVRWLHINLFKWRLWLYFYKLETTGLPSKKERERGRERESTNVAEGKHSYLQDVTISGICHYSAHLWKDGFGDDNLQRKTREIDQSDKGKWCLRQKEDD